MNRIVPVVTLALALAAPGCNKKTEEGGAVNRAGVAGYQPRASAKLAMPNEAAPAPAAVPPDIPASAAAGGAIASENAPSGPQTVPDLPRMLVRNGTATIKVDSLAAGMRAVRALAQRVGAFVAGESVSSGDNEVRQGMLQLKVPSNRFDEAVQALSTVGKVENVEVTSEDVGQEYVDVNARLENSKRLEQRLLTLLETRTGKLEDVLAVERELANVRETIERLTARTQFLQRQVSVSTLSVTVHEPAPIAGEPGQHPVLDAFGNAWRIFIGFVAFVIASLGIVIPLGVIAGVAWWAVAWWRRRHAQPVPKVAA